jgi:1,2-phenylacetyl-CoA epoxidase catalytic subunit
MTPASNRARTMVSPDQMSDEYRTMLVKMLTVQMSSEYATPIMVPWLTRAPSADERIEEALAFADEMRHGKGVADILRAIGFDPDPLIEEAQRGPEYGRRKLDIFHVTIDTWEELCIYRMVAERAGAIQALGTATSTYLPLADWSCRSAYDEGEIHSALGRRRVPKLLKDGRVAELQRALDKWMPLSTDMFGRPDSANEQRYLELGIKNLSNREVRRRFADVMEKEIGDLKPLKLPDPYRGLRETYTP